MFNLFIRFQTTALLSLVFLTLGSCTKESKSEPIDYGHDHCHHCKMTLTDRRFGGEILTPKGKIFKFDSIECLIQFRKKAQSIHEWDEKSKIFLVDSRNQGEFITAEQALFFIDPQVKSPMGQGILVIDSIHSLKQISPLYPSKPEVYNWQTLQTHLQN